MLAEASIRSPRRRSFWSVGSDAAVWSVTSVGAFLLIWSFLTDGLGWSDGMTIASPLDVVRTIISMSREPFAGLTLVDHLLASLHRWTLGVLAAVALGIPLGVLMAWNRTIDAALAPIFEPLRNIPPLAWIPLVIVWFGTETVSQAALVFIGAFPPCVLNSSRAVHETERIQLAAARNLGAPKHAQLLEIVLPNGLPTIFAGLRIAFSNGWMALVGAELVGAPSGLGFLIVRGQENLSAAVILTGMAMIGMVGLATDILLRVTVAVSLPWRRRATSAHA